MFESQRRINLLTRQTVKSFEKKIKKQPRGRLWESMKSGFQLRYTISSFSFFKNRREIKSLLSIANDKRPLPTRDVTRLIPNERQNMSRFVTNERP